MAEKKYLNLSTSKCYKQLETQWACILSFLKILLLNDYVLFQCVLLFLMLLSSRMLSWHAKELSDHGLSFSSSHLISWSFFLNNSRFENCLRRRSSCSLTVLTWCYFINVNDHLGSDIPAKPRMDTRRCDHSHSFSYHIYQDSDST